ncbi:cation:proton antiporter [Kitasatospora purpeofusca]|uniref:cation:proton antiporter n=1 Tax=Kitasatospora purpeofusca TaxID=67352 RepID=UPI0022549D4D|nr:cation:proton antiporter [Kitasatospora purpeofusca]MCX4757222.1 cation:proton antiporter [Kitasatospora purpeofusca]WSR35023.1 cation:proton antiporter [Kitasatospora purpeofusca]
MTVTDLAIIAGLVFVWGMLSARLEHFDMTAPIVFTAAGVLLTHGPLAPLGITPSAELVKVLAEATLALVLFSDASRVGLRQLRADMGLCLRLLGIGLPLSIGLGTLAAFMLPGVGSIWLALLVGAALAPTDAALGAAVMVNRAVPARIRRLINVESGLNDGIATPIVLVAIAGASTAEHAGDTGLGKAVAELALGLLIGAVVGGGGRLTKVGRDRGWVAEGFAGAAVLGLALCCYATSVALDGNGFIAAFTGGLAFTAAGGPAAKLVPFVEDTGALLSLLVWLVFGVVAVVPALEALTWQTALYAVLSLTVIRMLPVALALTGAGLGRPAVLFVGWFGPRGLASVVFGLLALEDLGEPAAQPAVTVIGFTVLLSVLAHGLTADPLAKRYGPRLAALPGTTTAAPAGLAEIPERRLIRRAPAADRRKE